MQSNVLNKREQTVLDVLREYQKNNVVITTFELMQKAHNTRPSNEIVTLRKKGYLIKTFYFKSDKGKLYGGYLLISEPLN